MGWFSYKCEKCGEFKVSLKKRDKYVTCPDCGDTCHPILKGGTVRVVELLDNGAMSRRVERLHNIEEIMEEREKKFRKDDNDDEGTD